jgi:sugar (pentulose or hexulose) kinase
VVDPGELAAFCSSDGHWLPLVCTMNVTVATELTRNLLNMDIHSLNINAEKAAAGADGLLLLPYFNGERTPALPHARATLFGMSSTNYTPENLCRAAMEGATFGLRYGLEVLNRNGITQNNIRLVGGGAKSKVWRQIVAEVFNCPVICPITQAPARWEQPCKPCALHRGARRENQFEGNHGRFCFSGFCHVCGAKSAKCESL